MARGECLHRFSALFWAIGVGVGIVVVAAVAVPTSPAAGPERGPVAAFSFDEGEGSTAEDVTGDGHTAALEGAEWVRGRYGDALRFDGTSACATIADATDLRFSEEFTVEAWVRPEGPRSHEPILVKEGGGFPDYSLGIGSLLAEASIGTAGGGHESIAASPLEADVWRHLAATFDGASLRLYVDGELVATKAVASPDSSGAGPLTLGCDRLLGTHFDGRVDEVRIYDRALGGTEVTSDMEAPLQTPKAGPVAAWSFDEGEDTTAEDVTGDGHTATIEGAEWARGKYGDGLSFDEETDVVRVANSPEFDLSEEFTLEAWVRPETEWETWAPVLSKKGDRPSEQLWWLYVAGNKYNRPYAGIEESPGFEESVEAPEPIPPETWTHLALTWDGSLTSLYVDGRLVASAFTDPPRVGGGELEIGADTGFGDYFLGRIDEVRIYDRSLTAAEVGTDMGTPMRSPRSGPVAAWSFDEGEGSTSEDLTGDGHTATIEGAEWARGKYGAALKFDGESDVLRVPHSPEFDLAEGFTLEAWVRPESAVNQWAPIVDKLGEGKHAYEQPWWLYEANQKVNVPFAGIEPSAGRETSIEANESESLPVDAWSHLAVTWDGSLMSLYVGGRLVRSTPAGPLRATANGEVQIGADTELGDFLDGRIDELRIYARPLDTGEIDADMEAPLETPKAGPVAAWSFDEGEGMTAEDVTGHGHTATVEGAEWVRGHYGDALRFVGGSACATVVDTADLRFGEEFTLESWVRPEGARSHEPVLFKEGGGFPDYSLGIGSQTAEASIGTAAGGRESVAASPLEADVWRHLAATFDGARLRLYVDGGLVATRAVPSPDAAGPGPLQIGCDALDGTHFDGRIDEARIYGRALTSGEVQADMATPLQTPKQGPVAAWSFDEGEGTTAEDLTGDGHTATIEGAEWVRGRYGDALRFDGGSDVVKVADSPEFDLTEEFTTVAWVRPESQSNEWAPILAKEMGGGETAHELAWRLYEGGTESNRPVGGTDPLPGIEDNVNAPDQLPVDVWSHLALTWDGAKLRLFVDGALVASAAGSPPPVTEGELQIGAATEHGDHFVGRIDEARIYNRALSEAEVQRDMDSTFPVAITVVATEVESNDAMMTGTAQVHGPETEYYFEYGPTTEYRSVATGEEVEGDGEIVEVEETAVDLAPETTYHYRLIAEGPLGTSFGEDKTFTTGSRTISIEEEEAEEAPAPTGPTANLTLAAGAGGFFGIDWDGDLAQMANPKPATNDFARIAESGSKFVRFRISPGQAGVPKAFEEAKRLGLTALPYIGEGDIPPNKQAWFNYAKRIVNEYGVEFLEIGNEPNRPPSKKNKEGLRHAEEFGEYYEEMVREVRKSVSGVHFLLPGLYAYKPGKQGHITPRAFLRRMKLQLGKAEHPLVDPYQGISLHPYVFRVRNPRKPTAKCPHPNPAPHKPTTSCDAEQVAKEIEQTTAGVRNIEPNTPIWITEFGFPVRSSEPTVPAVTEEEQAKLVRQSAWRLVRKRKRLDVAQAIYYNIQDLAAGPEWSHHTGLLDAHRRTREAWAAFMQVVKSE